MGETIELTAVDGHSLGAYRATPSGATVGRLVIAQEIFGVNGHIRAVCDGFAADGYAVIAPALFDRTERGAELGYDETGFARGRELSSQTGNDNAVCDLAATLDAARDGAMIGVVGYCWAARSPGSSPPGSMSIARSATTARGSSPTSTNGRAAR